MQRKKIVVFKVPTPSIAMQEHTILDNDYFSDMPTIKINTKVSKKFSGEKTFETSATVSGENVTEGADHTFSFESNKEKVTVYGTVTPSIPDGVGSEGAPFHRGPAKSNISYEEANYTWTINPSASLQIYPGDSVIFNTNTNFF
ncbi:hypothetical protein [Brochothrix campestris]|uniref:Uncharacterized protein n=1 Tax=Brochothrix campestris FSL F6-1037 TaxID=1265861 RepID=W7CID0_9LIST|nr:hypothetical protein [Brochothrix campestris]EUJ36722.1 hypothetical protein BCAMP_10625 [Brochothrix campestris FSL F6-1037]